MLVPGPGDEDLLAGCLRNDAAAWGLFVERYARLVHWSIRKTLTYEPPGGRDEFCREVFQDFFERLLDKNELSRLREAKNIRKFLSVMACHLAVDKHKALSRRAKSTQELEEASPAEAAEPVPVEVGAALEGCLAELKPKERACVEFFILEGKSAVEIGTLLGMSPDNVSSTVRRTKEKLKKMLLEAGHEF